MGEHALLSASSSGRWLVCTPSARMEEKLTDTTSPYAEEGTRAHALAEQYLKEYLKVPGFSSISAETDQEMIEAVMKYADIVVEKINEARAVSPDAEVHIEYHLDYSPWAPEGFGTGDTVIVSDHYIEIVDLKYGKGAPVSAVGNTQMRLYALGAHNAFGICYGYDNVKMTIVQPRLDSVSTDEISIAELLAWGTSIRPIAQQAWSGKGAPTAGVHCRFCRCRTTCRALAEYMLSSVKKDFAPGAELEDWEISDIILKAKEIKSWLKDIEEYALSEALSGTTWPGLKVVEGISRRKITDEDKAASILQLNGYEHDTVYKPRELKTITELEKLCGKKHFSELLKEFIEKPEGKPTLVSETDKREPMQLQDVADDFDDTLLEDFIQKGDKTL
ncbi:DUF2800 domain-containing protein [Megasphaera sueciensis]|uniref:DUF2800 domain-containing protein n=1 Tax=Megasphaera sueciensis TaxID=349094 RepID=UPI003CFDF912